MSVGSEDSDTEENSDLKRGREPLSSWITVSVCFPCLAVSILLVFLFLTVLFSALEVPLGIEPITLGKSLAFLYRESVAPIFVILGDMLKSLSPWGLIVFVILSVIIWGPNWIRETLSSSKWELPGGIKFDGTGIPAVMRKELSEAARVVDKANKEIGEAYQTARSFASQLRDRYDISATVGEVASEVTRSIGNRCPEDFRLTLYVPDFIFSDRLYQFTDYYDRSGQKMPGSKTGRTFSVRYGVIGRVWRSGVSEIEGDLISPEDRRQLKPGFTKKDMERFIARRWGLSLEEAIHVSDYNSYGAMMITRADKKLGILYFDSKKVDAFCEREEQNTLEAKLSTMLESSPLLLKLLEIGNEVAPWSGRIQIFRNS